MQYYREIPDLSPQFHPLDIDHPVVNDGEGLVGEPFDFAHQDINEYVLGKVPAMIAMARLTLANAVSPRGFEVANVCVYEDREGGPWQYYDRDGTLMRGEGPRIATIATANFKTKVREEVRDVYDIDDIDKNCAETNSLIIAGHAYLQRLHTSIVVATTNGQRIETVNNERTPTLCLCSVCIGHYKKNPIVDDDSLIITGGSGQDILEIRSNKQIQRTDKLKRRGMPAKEPHQQVFRSAEWALRQQEYRANKKAHNLSLKKCDRDKLNSLFRYMAKKPMLPVVRV